MTTKATLTTLLLATATLLLGACDSFSGNNAPPPLEGERISIMELQESLSADTSPENLSIPAPWKNEFWPQAGGYPNHSMQHLSLNTNIEKTWENFIGPGRYDNLILTSQPIVIDGMIYTIDTRSIARALELEKGRVVWSTYIGSQKDDEPVIVGGLAYSNGRIYATNGLNELIALEPKTGEVIWRKKLTAVSQAAPTILDGRIYISTIDNRLLALNEEDGAILWEYEGLQEGTGLIGGVSPAANSDIVVPVFSSGEVAALRVENGSLAWSENLDSTQSFGGLSSLSDIKAAPIIDKGLLIAMNFGGRMAAIDIRSGNRIWQRDIGGSSTPWVAGDAIFALSNDNHLFALNRETGLIYWVKKLAAYKNPDNRKDPITWHGPVLAGGRLILAGSHGGVIEAEAQSGEIIKQWSVKHGISTTPIVAGETLYLLSAHGTLYAYR